MKFQLRFAARECQRQVNAVVQQRLHQFRRIARLDGDRVFGKAFLELAQHRRNDVLAGRGAGAEPQPALAPFAQMPQRLARGFHLL